MYILPISVFSSSAAALKKVLEKFKGFFATRKEGMNESLEVYILLERDCIMPPPVQTPGESTIGTNLGYVQQ